MRIAHVVASYHPRLGEVETHVRRIAEACASAGEEVTVLTRSHQLAKHGRDFDLVHAHGYRTLASHAAARSDLPFVFTPHYRGTGQASATRLLHRVYHPAGVWVFAKADAVICVSEAERDLVLGDFLTVARKIRIIPNGTSGETSADPARLPSWSDVARQTRELYALVIARSRDHDGLQSAQCG